MCAAPASAAALAVLCPRIFNHPFPFFPLTIVFLAIDIVTSARIVSVCIEDVVVRINTSSGGGLGLYRLCSPWHMWSALQSSTDGPLFVACLLIMACHQAVCVVWTPAAVSAFVVVTGRELCIDKQHWYTAQALPQTVSGRYTEPRSNI